MLEAMKMETEVLAYHSGVVESINCSAGDKVVPDVSLMKIK